MAALQATDDHLHGDVTLVGLHLFIFERGGHVDAASRADAKLALGLVVDVQ